MSKAVTFFESFFFYWTSVKPEMKLPVTPSSLPLNIALCALGGIKKKKRGGGIVDNTGYNIHNERHCCV